jgi:hypothetical protein
MDTLDDDIRSTADAITDDAKRILEIEIEKASLVPDDPRLVPLSEEAARIADRLSVEAGIEETLAHEAVDTADG